MKNYYQRVIDGEAGPITVGSWTTVFVVDPPDSPHPEPGGHAVIVYRSELLKHSDPAAHLQDLCEQIKDENQKHKIIRAVKPAKDGTQFWDGRTAPPGSKFRNPTNE